MKPVAGKPCPSVWPIRVKPKGARAVHAGRECDFLGSMEIHTACRGWYLDLDRTKAFGRVLPANRKVTCKGCLKRLARPLSISEVWMGLHPLPTDSEEKTDG